MYTNSTFRVYLAASYANGPGYQLTKSTGRGGRGATPATPPRYNGLRNPLRRNEVTDHIANETLRRIRNLATVAAPDPRFDALRTKVSLSHVLFCGAEMRQINGENREYFEETARRANKGYDPYNLIAGWELFTRADQVNPASTGGYLTATGVPTAADALRPTMVCGALGATFVDAKANISWPRQTGIASATWLGSESTTITEANQTLSNLGLTPHTVGVYTEVSRQLLLQSSADAIVRRDVVKAVGNAADLAALYGTGASGQPVGLTLDNGILTFSGTAAAAATFCSAFVALGDALDDDTPGLAVNRTLAGTLRTRPETTGSSQTVWQGKLTNGTVIDFAARSSTALSSGNVILGNWKYLVIAAWGGGIELSINPYGDGVTGTTNFQKGIVGYRAMLTMDSGAIYPAAFNYGAAVT
jgi:HK97 family phage major capsid protein